MESIFILGASRLQLAAIKEAKNEAFMYMYWTMILKQLALHMQTNIYP